MPRQGARLSLTLADSGGRLPGHHQRGRGARLLRLPLRRRRVGAQQGLAHGGQRAGRAAHHQPGPEPHRRARPRSLRDGRVARPDGRPARVPRAAARRRVGRAARPGAEDPVHLSRRPDSPPPRAASSTAGRATSRASTGGRCRRGRPICRATSATCTSCSRASRCSSPTPRRRRSTSAATTSPPSWTSSSSPRSGSPRRSRASRARGASRSSTRWRARCTASRRGRRRSSTRSRSARRCTPGACRSRPSTSTSCASRPRPSACWACCSSPCRRSSSPWASASCSSPCAPSGAPRSSRATSSPTSRTSSRRRCRSSACSASCSRRGSTRARARRASTPASSRASRERLAHLIDNVLDFARLERGKASYNFAEGRLDEVVERALDVCRYRLDKEKMKLRTDIEPILPPVRMDEDAMTLVLLNLVDNAVKYAGEGGEVGRAPRARAGRRRAVGARPRPRHLRRRPAAHLRALLPRDERAHAQRARQRHRPVARQAHRRGARRARRGRERARPGLDLHGVRAGGAARDAGAEERAAS